MTLTRAKFEELTADLVEKTMGPTRQALSDAGLTPIRLTDYPGGAPPGYPPSRRPSGSWARPLRVNDEVVIWGRLPGRGAQRRGQDILLLDATPLPGIETLGGVFTKIIERNTTIPTTKKQIFSTAADNQTSVEIHVLQGERAMAADNKTLGRFILDGIPPAPRGVPQIEVSFDIDANGIVKVSAKDLGTGKEQRITITASSGLDQSQIEEMVRQAEKYAEEDRKRRELADARNQADSLAYNAEKSLKDLGDKVDPAKAEEIRRAVADLRSVAQGEDLEKIKQASEKLTGYLHELSAKLYEQAQQQQAGPSGPAGERVPADDNVVDADYDVKT